MDVRIFTLQVHRNSSSAETCWEQQNHFTGQAAFAQSGGSIRRSLTTESYGELRRFHLEGAKPEAARKKLGSADRGPIGQLAGLFDSAKQDTSREQAVVLQVVVPLANIAPRGEALRRAR